MSYFHTPILRVNGELTTKWRSKKETEKIEIHVKSCNDFTLFYRNSCIIDEYWKSDQKTRPKMEMLKDLLTEYLEYSGVWCYADIS